MKLSKKLLAAVLAVLMVLSISACHPKDEIALTIGDVEITSALYMYALLEADSAARSQIDAEASAAASSSNSASLVTEAIDYHSKEIEGKKFSDWVKDTAITRCREIAFYESICKEKGLTLSEETQANVDSMVDMYWSYYGYAALYEPNGVGKDTFKRAITADYLTDEYFFFLYGEGGEKEVDNASLKTKAVEKYLTADVLQASISSSTKEEDKTKLIAQFKDYEKRLNDGEDFEKVYNHYYGIEEDKTTSSTASEAETTEEKTYKYPYASILAAKDSGDNYASELYDTVKALKNDEVKYIESETAITVLVRRDMESDELRMEDLCKTVLWNEKNEEFQKGVDEEAAKLSLDENTFATKRFKVKNIIYPAQ